MTRRGDQATTGKTDVWLLAILALFAGLGVIYSLVTPIFEASDERWHYPVVKYILDTRRLPVQDASESTLWHQEGSQPPLYYLLSAGLISWVNTRDFEQLHRPNPHAIVGLPLEVGNKNMMLHTDREDWPWRGTTLSVHLIRLFSVVLGVVTVYLTWRIARHVWPQGRWIPLLAAALTAFNPMYLFITASVNNDALAAPLAAGVILLLLGIIKRGQTRRDSVWLGVLLGFGALTKLSVLSLIPITAIVLTWDAARSRRWREWLVNGLILAALAALIAGWWYYRNWSLYGDPTGINRMLEIVGRRNDPVTLQRLAYEFEGFRISYWALFGAVNVVVATWIYRVLDVLVVVSGLGLVAGLASKWPGKRKPGRSTFGLTSGLAPVPVFLLAGWVGLAFLSLVRWTCQTYASQGRLMFVAISGISVLMAAGLGCLVPGSWRKALSGTVSSGLLLLAALCPLLYIAPAYASQPLQNQADIPADVQVVDWNIDGRMRLVGYRMPSQVVRPAEALPLTVYWQALESTSTDYSVFVHLLGRERSVVGQVNTYPGLGGWPTSRLKPGDVVADTYLVPVDADAAAPSVLRIHAGLYDYDEPGRPALPATNEEGQPVEPWLASAKLIPWDWPPVDPSHPLDIHFDDHVSLAGYDFEPPGLTLYWEADGRPGHSYTVFVQVWDDQGQVAGFDGQPVMGDYPTNWWDAGEIIVDEHQIDRSQLPAGDYQLLVGLYRLETGERLTAFGPEGPLTDNAVVIPYAR